MTRLASLWAAYIFLVAGLVLIVSQLNQNVGEIRQQNCTLGEIELLVTDLIVSGGGSIELDEFQFSQLESAVARLGELCD